MWFTGLLRRGGGCCMRGRRRGLRGGRSCRRRSRISEYAVLNYLEGGEAAKAECAAVGYGGE